MKQDQVSDNKSFAGIHEDWVSVILGFIVIVAALAVFVLPAPSFGWKGAGELTGKVFGYSNVTAIALQFVMLYALTIAGTFLSGRSARPVFAGFPVVFVLALVATLIAGNAVIKELNLEAVIFSLALGLFISNFLRVPRWLKDSLSTELYVKTGLVLLGTTVIFGDILKAGSLGLVQALGVVVSVWYFAYWLCRKLKVDDELTMMISSAVSICGVSAAIATAGAIKGDTKKLSYVISLVLVTAIPMMIFMPLIASYFDFPEEVTGAWLGGSIDTTGAVVASGTLVGETALKISTIVKFSQNVLLGIAAFGISLYWSFRKESNHAGYGKPTVSLIWERFPKFVLGFLAASLVFSFLLEPDVINSVKDSLKSIQTLWFVLAFTSIGLETHFSDLFNSESKRPFAGFMIAQLFNILVTLLIAWLLFRH